MCGRFVASSPPSVIAEQFDVKDVVDADLPPRWNVAPTMDALVVSLSREGQRIMRPLRWGLVPWWADSPAIGSRFINARAETLSTSRAFRSALQSRRCIVPADGFYEWKPVPASAAERGSRRSGARGRDRSGRSRPAPRRRPYFVRPARTSEGGLFALAGLWERWRDAEGEWLRSFTIVTTEANAALAPIHGRMPALLPAESWPQWLDAEGTDAPAALGLLVPAPVEAIEILAVSYLVNSPRNEGPELTDEIAEQPELG